MSAITRRDTETNIRAVTVLSSKHIRNSSSETADSYVTKWHFFQFDDTKNAISRLLWILRVCDFATYVEREERAECFCSEQRTWWSERHELKVYVVSTAQHLGANFDASLEPS